MVRVTGTYAPVSTRDNYCRVLIYLFRTATKLGHGDLENISHTTKSQPALLVDVGWDYFCESREIVNKAGKCKYQYQIYHVLPGHHWAVGSGHGDKQTNTSRALTSHFSTFKEKKYCSHNQITSIILTLK